MGALEEGVSFSVHGHNFPESRDMFSVHGGAGEQ